MNLVKIRTLRIRMTYIVRPFYAVHPARIERSYLGLLGAGAWWRFMDPLSSVVVMRVRAIQSFAAGESHVCRSRSRDAHSADVCGTKINAKMLRSILKLLMNSYPSGRVCGLRKGTGER